LKARTLPFPCQSTCLIAKASLPLSQPFQEIHAIWYRSRTRSGREVCTSTLSPEPARQAPYRCHHRQEQFRSCSWRRHGQSSPLSCPLSQCFVSRCRLCSVSRTETDKAYVYQTCTAGRSVNRAADALPPRAGRVIDTVSWLWASYLGERERRP
jgi:hypothetical protein